MSESGVQAALDRHYRRQETLGERNRNDSAMRDWYFGSIDRRQLHLRWLTPFEFAEWCDLRKWHLSWRRMLNPGNWWRAIKNRHNWAARAKWFANGSHRCYCITGKMCDGKLEVAGWGVIWWYSHFTGELPCICDKALAEWRAKTFQEDEFGEPATATD